MNRDSRESLNIPKIYNDPIIYRKRKGDAFYPYKEIKESITVQTNYALLTEVPNRHDKVKVRYRDKPLYEVEDGFLDENQFRVDYTNGWVYLHESLQGETVKVEYLGEGVFMFPDSRVYHTGDPRFPTVKNKFEDVDRSILVQKSRVDEQLRSVPQPSEVVDLRIDHNGKIYPVAKDRIDFLQREVEDARVDAFNRKHANLKTRIDSMQFAVEEEFTEKDKENTRIWAFINLIPGKIEMETGRLEEKVNGDMLLLKSRIELIPEKIALSVEELKQYTNGELQRTRSSIEILKDNIELKVDVNGIISSINLSKEGVQIKGKNIQIDGHTHIAKASIKSAHIDSLSADKITAGRIDAGKIVIHGGSSTNYTTINGAFLESRGKHTREWRGETTTHDIKIKMENGRIRARNDFFERSLYYSDNGISTFADGSGQYIYDVEKTSGTFEFFSYKYGTPRGVTVYSVGTFGINTRNIMLDAKRDITIRARGMISFSSTNVRGTAIGIRDNNTNFYIGVRGALRVTTNSFYNGGKPNYRDVEARDYKGRRFIDTGGQSYIYMGSNLGVRITSKGTNGLSKVYYRPIQASAFQVRSSRTSKENIRNTKISGLEEVNKLNIVDFNYKGDPSENTGFIAEDSPEITSDDNEFVDLSKTVAVLAKAVQELNAKIENQTK